MNAAEFLSVPDSVAKEASKIVLPDPLVKAAMQVCSRPEFLGCLREQLPTLAFAAMCDKEYGQKSTVGLLRNDFKAGIKGLQKAAAWAGQDERHSPLYIAYWRGRSDGEGMSDAAALDRLKSDIDALARMLTYAQRELKLLEAQPCTKRELLFPKALAQIVIALTAKFDLPSPSLSDFGVEVKLMAAIACWAEVELSQEAARQTLSKAINEAAQGNK